MSDDPVHLFDPPKDFLILHKVRGEPAFDIARQVNCAHCLSPDCDCLWHQGLNIKPCPACDGQGYWWIIPTSGHRAFPYITWPLVFPLDIGPLCEPSDIIQGKGDWLDWPDHYSYEAAPRSGRDLSGILSIIGLGAKPIRKRGIS